MMAIMCLLSPQQTSLLQTQRHLTVHEDGTKEASSSDIESTDTEANKLQLDKALTKMRQSDDRTDIRLINLTKIGN